METYHRSIDTKRYNLILWFDEYVRDNVQGRLIDPESPESGSGCIGLQFPPSLVNVPVNAWETCALVECQNQEGFDLSSRINLTLRIVVLLMIFPAAHEVDAQDSSLQERDTWSSILVDAALNYPSVKSRIALYESASNDLAAAKWERFPALSVEANAPDSGPSGGVVRIEQPLWTGGRILGGIDRALAAKKGARSAVDEAQLDIMIRVSGVFYDVMRNRELLEIAKRSENVHRELFNMIDRRVSSEINPGSDRLLAKNRLQQSVNDRVNADRSYFNALNELSTLIGRYPEELVVSPLPMLEAKSLAEAQNRAISYSPRGQRLKSEIDVVQSEERITRSSTAPTVTVGYQERFGDTDFPGQEKGYGYVAMRMQTGSGLAIRSQLQAVYHRRLSAIEELRRHEVELMAEIHRSWQDMQSLSLQLDAAMQMASGADEMVDSYLRQFRVARKSWLDVLNIQRERVQAHNSAVDTYMLLEQSKLKVLLLSGQINLSNLKGLPREH